VLQLPAAPRMAEASEAQKRDVLVPDRAI